MTSPTASRAVAWLTFAASLSGCALGPDYERPDVPTPATFRGVDEVAAAPASLADQPWWEVFQDQTLVELIRVALANNHDARIAATRIEQARAGVGVARAMLLPRAGYEGNAAHGEHTFLGRPFPIHDVASSFIGTLNVIWEIDLWGRIRRSTEAAEADLLASQEVRRGVWLTLVSSVAQAYFELLELDLELDIARRTTESFAGSLRIFQERLDRGSGTRLETALAEAALATAAATVPDIERRIAQKENELNLLLGRQPGPVPRTSTLLGQRKPPEVPAGLPSALLERRPDIREAEQRVVATNAEIGVAVASFFPRIGLTAFGGGLSQTLRDLTGSAGVWSLAATVSGPLFEGGRLLAAYDGSEAAWQEAVLRYDRGILAALHEVSDVLIARIRLEEIQAQQVRAVTALEEAVTLSTQLYRAGKSSYDDVLDSQQQLFPAETALARTELDRLLVIVQLYKALGGGWNLADEEWAPAVPE